MSSSLRRLRGLFGSTAAARTTKHTSKSLKPVSRIVIPHSDTSETTSENWTPVTKETRLKNVVEKFKEASFSANFRRNKSYNYVTTVRRLVKEKQFSLIEEIIEHQKQFKDITDEPFVVRLIFLYGIAGMIDQAHKLFDEMPQLNCPRTNLSFNALLSACVRAKKFDKVGQLFVELPGQLGIKPDTVSYNIYIKSLCQMGSLDSALQMIDQMEDNGLKPDVVNFTTLLNALYKKKKVADAENLWAAMESKNVVPNVRSYNPKLRRLVADNRISEAVDLIAEMRAKGVKPDVFSFYALIKGFCDYGNLEEAKRWYEDMALNHLIPNQLTYETILRFACSAGDFDYAFDLCKEAINLKCVVRGRIMQNVVDGLVKVSKTEKAGELIDMGLGRINKYFDYKLILPTE